MMSVSGQPNLDIIEEDDGKGRVVGAFRPDDIEDVGGGANQELAGDIPAEEQLIDGDGSGDESDISALDDPLQTDTSQDGDDGDRQARRPEEETQSDGGQTQRADSSLTPVREDRDSQNYTDTVAQEAADDASAILAALNAQAAGYGLGDASTAETAAFYGPQTPHESGETGGHVGGMSPGNGPDAGSPGNIGAPAAATTLDNLGRFLSEYNHANTGSDDFWDAFWGGLTPEGWAPNFHWNLTSSGTSAKNGVITYNIGANNYDSDGITDDGADATSRINAIRHAFNVYEDILGINFSETTAFNADINFGNETSGEAFANFNAVGKTTDGNASGIISDAWINIAKNWSGNGTIGDYYFHTALHEIGHTLGLGHQGDYNAGSSPTYNGSAQWENDTIQFTMMSYWDQANYTAPGESTPSGTFLGDVNIIGPQAVDWLTLDRMYNPMGFGIDDGTTTNNTTWGFNSTWVDWTPTSSGPAFGYSNTAYASLDTLLGTSTVTIVDGGGIDTLDLSGFSNNTKIDVSEVLGSHLRPSFSDVAGQVGNLAIGVGTTIENVVGGSGSERIYANAAANNLDGNGGDDSLYGYGGNDTLIGDSGNDYLSASSGNDSLLGGADNDSLYGSSGNDTLDGGTGNDYLSASSGTDSLRGQSGQDTLYGSSGNDTMDGGSGNDYLNGGSDNDSMIGGSGVDTLLGSLGNDTLLGGLSTDSIDGGGGNDLIRVLNGEYYDSVDGGTGQDTLDHSAHTQAGDIFNFAAGTISGYGGGTVANIETYLDGSGGNTIHSDGSGLFDGNAGNDTIFAGLGSLETLDGGTGIDLLNTTTWSGNYVVNLATGLTNYTGESFVNFENLISGAGNDTLTGTGGANSILGGLGNDSILGGSGVDTLLGGAGNDTLLGGFTADSINGGAGNDLIRVLDGEYYDSVDGGTGQDTLDHSAHTQAGDIFNFAAGTISGYGGGTVANIETYLDGSGGNTIHSDGSGLFDGNAGNDTMFAGLGSLETLDGGTGIDLLNTTTWSGNYVVNLATGLTNYTGESFVNFENLISGAGNDTLTGTSGANSIEGGAGNDILDGGSGGHDTLRGEGGNDTLEYSRSTTVSSDVDINDGGGGNDTFLLSSTAFDNRWSINLTTGQFNYLTSLRGTLISIENVTINNGAVVTGNGSANVITGLGVFNNTFDGSGGNDTLLGGDGNDTLDGGTGNDSLDGGAGDDSLDGGGGINMLFGGAGNDRLNRDGGGSLEDEYYGGADIDTIGADGTSFNSSVHFDLAAGFLILGASNYEVWNGFENYDASTGTGQERVSGTGGANLIETGSGANNLVGRGGNDTILAGGGNDTLSGGGDDDRLEGDVGNDILRGGSGLDTLLGGDGLDTLNGGTGDDSMSGGNDADTLNGQANNDTLSGDAGDDVLLGGNGNDTLLGGTENDTLNGGNGHDSALGESGTDNLLGGGGLDTLDGGSGNDTLAGGDGNDSLLGGADDDLIGGGNNNDRLYGDTGFDTLNGGNGNDGLWGGDDDDTLNGQGDNDELFGGIGNDILNGGSGNDDLNGGAGNDTLNGGTGNDTFAGGSGLDTFVFSGAFGQNVITDFSANNAEDVDLSGVGAIIDFADLLANHLFDNSGTAQIVSGGNSILLLGVTVGEIGNALAYSDDDFIF